jgi:hypothetical protein
MQRLDGTILMAHRPGHIHRITQAQCAFSLRTVPATSTELRKSFAHFWMVMTMSDERTISGTSKLAAAQGGGRAGGVRDPDAGAAEHEDLDPVGETEAIGMRRR